MIRAEGVSVAIGGRTLLAGLDLQLVAGRVLAVLGPNGVGKSTLLGTLAGELPPGAGRVWLDDGDLHRVSAGNLARRRAVLTQDVAFAFPFRVGEVVGLGRWPHRGHAGVAADDRALAIAADAAQVADWWERDYRRLSGGERQRVQFARAVAQVAPVDGVPRILFLDEPTAALDLRHQHAILQAARRLAVQHGLAVALITHDPNLAAAYADEVLLMAPGMIAYHGDVGGLEAGHLARTFGMAVDCLARPDGGRTFAWRPAA